ncbi:conserved Plasmodium protein, unknown function [Plasmodium relictum]|uniref:C2 domain-containing protein n=1 Tax=Plasmodium relictum TaxID=85471 RepID=A0A1J1H1Q6_PLARL|nr:conserved Plasmodium protein, unknown function [Plasmodium relictum]CRG98795.1 conserved Plasmodium protein, unknown function [Plasmodium relictum]
MPCIVKVRISGIRDFNTFEKSEIDSFKYIEVTLGETKQRTKFNINRNTNDLNLSFRLEIADDSELQTCPLKIIIDDVENINNGYIQIDFSFFYFHDNLKLEGWFPLYDSLAGLKGELYCIIKWEFFEEKNPYNDNSADVLLLGTTSFPNNSPYHIEQIIDFAHELKIVNDPEYDWKDLIRSNRNSNEARCDVIQNSFMQTRKIIGKKAKLLGGNAILGYQEHLNLEGSTTNKICIRIIGTVVKLRKNSFNDINYCNFIEKDSIKNILRNNELFFENNYVKNKDENFNKRENTRPYSSYNYVDVILLTLDSLPNNIKYTYGGLVASKAVKVLHQRVTEDHRDEWLLEIRDELKSNAKFLSCNAILGYKEDIYIFNDVIVLYCYGTAINIFSCFFFDDKIISFVNNEDKLKYNYINLDKDTNCIYLHYSSNEIENNKVLCRMCNEAFVPKIFISSSNIPEDLAIIGNGFLISAFVVYPLKKHYGEYLASEISEILPFLELNLHKQIICKLLVNGFNSIFDYNLKLCFNHNYLFGFCHGTGICTYGIYSENKFLIKSNYKDNFYIKNKYMSASELKTIYDNINYRSFFSKNKSLISPIFIKGHIVNNNDIRNKTKETNKIITLDLDKKKKDIFYDEKKNLINYNKFENEEDCNDNNYKITNNNYFRLKEIYIKKENDLNESNDSETMKNINYTCNKDNDVDNLNLEIKKKKKKKKKKKEKYKAKKNKNKSYIYEVEDHLDNITLLNIYHDIITLYNYIFNLDAKIFLLKKMNTNIVSTKKNICYSNLLEPVYHIKNSEIKYNEFKKVKEIDKVKNNENRSDNNKKKNNSTNDGNKKSKYTHNSRKNSVNTNNTVGKENNSSINCVKFSNSHIQKKKFSFLETKNKLNINKNTNYRDSINNKSKKLEKKHLGNEMRESEHIEQEKNDIYKEQLDKTKKEKMTKESKKNNGNEKEKKRSKFNILESENNNEKNKYNILIKEEDDSSIKKMNNYMISEFNEKKCIDINSHAKIKKNCNYSLKYAISENSSTFDYEVKEKKNSLNNYTNYFFYIFTLDFLPNIRFESYYEIDNNIYHYENSNIISNSEYVSDSKIVINSIRNSLVNNTNDEDNEVSIIKNKNIEKSTNNISKHKKKVTNLINEIKRNEDIKVSSFYSNNNQIFSFDENENSSKIKEQRKKKIDEEKRKKKRQKKFKNKSKYNYLNNLSKSYIYLIKRINLFSDNNNEVDVIYEKINKAYIDLYNIFIFYIFIHNLFPCCICSIKINYSFVSFDILEIMLTGHLIKVKNNDVINLELGNMNKSIQENLLKHFFNHLENYYMEKSELFYNTNFFTYDPYKVVCKKKETNEFSQFGFITSQGNKKSKINVSNFFTNKFCNFRFFNFGEKIKNFFKRKRNKNMNPKGMIQKEKDKKKKKINKFHLLLKKGERKNQSTSEVNNLNESLLLFNQLKNYILLENRKNLYENYTENKFSSIIITPLNILPNVIIKKYFGVISLHIVKENINLKKFDFFYQSLISDILFIAKSHIKAIGANLISSFKITNLFLREEKSHGYALISICGDVAKI